MGYKDPERRRAYYAEYRIRNRERINRQKRSKRVKVARRARKPVLIHGHTVNRRTTREYRAWKNAKTRCLNPNRDSWKYYGGRGISICKEWSDDFAAFFRDMGRCPPGLTLERIDNNKGYEPGNCKWATMAEQNNNKGGSRI